MKFYTTIKPFGTNISFTIYLDYSQMGLLGIYLSLGQKFQESKI